MYKAMIHRRAAVLVFITVVSSTWMQPINASPLGTELDAGLRLVVSRQKAKANQNLEAEDYIQLEDKRDDAFDENNSECGNVNIGNVNGGNKIGQRPRNVTVVVTKNIVNLGDKDC